MPTPTGSAGNISPRRVIAGLSDCSLGAATGPCSASPRAYFSIAAASTSLASACVGTPKPGTSMPMMRTPLICLGSNCSGTPGRRRHAEIGDDDCIVQLGVGELEHRLADILEQLAGDQGFRIERHIAHRAARAVEVGRKGQAVHAAGRARQHRRGPPHAQPHPQRAESRAHALRLVVRTLGIIPGVAIQHRRFARARRRRRASVRRPHGIPRHPRRSNQPKPPQALRGRPSERWRLGVRSSARPRRRRFRGSVFRRTRRPACRPGSLA